MLQFVPACEVLKLVWLILYEYNGIMYTSAPVPFQTCNYNLFIYLFIYSTLNDFVRLKLECITKRRLFKYIENFTSKNWNFF